MTTFALNNLWTYIEGLSLKRKDREWLANKLLEPVADDKKIAINLVVSVFFVTLHHKTIK